MDDSASNDNATSPTARPPEEPDAYGHAAMLLVESLIHGLIARSLLSPAEAVEIVETALQVKTDMAASAGALSASARKSITLLKSLSDSLMIDVPPP